MIEFYHFFPFIGPPKGKPVLDVWTAGDGYGPALRQHGEPLWPLMWQAYAQGGTLRKTYTYPGPVGTLTGVYGMYFARGNILKSIQCLPAQTRAQTGDCRVTIRLSKYTHIPGEAVSITGVAGSASVRVTLRKTYDEDGNYLGISGDNQTITAYGSLGFKGGKTICESKPMPQGGNVKHSLIIMVSNDPNHIFPEETDLIFIKPDEGRGYSWHFIETPDQPNQGAYKPRDWTTCIVVTPDAGRTITKLKVNGEDRLAEGLANAAATRTTEHLDLAELTGNFDNVLPLGSVYICFSNLESLEIEAQGVEIEHEIIEHRSFDLRALDCATDGTWIVEGMNAPEGSSAVVDNVNKTLDVTISVDEYEGIDYDPHINLLYKGATQDVPVTLKLKVQPAPAFGTVWEPLATLNAAPTDAVAASDGNVYAVAGTKIYQITPTYQFTEVALNGAPTNKIHSITEAAGCLLITDDTHVWRKDWGDEKFTKTTMAVRSTGHSWILGHKNNAVFSITSSRINNIRTQTFDLDTEIQLTMELIVNGLHTPQPHKGITLPDGSMLIPANEGGGAPKKCVLMHVSADGLTFTKWFEQSDTGSGQNTTVLTVRDPSGRVYFMGGGLGLFYTDDSGETWEAIIDGVWSPRGLVGVLNLKSGYYVAGTTGGSGQFFRSTDGLHTLGDATASDVGLINRFVKLANYKLLAFTARTGAPNVYYSEA